MVKTVKNTVWEKIVKKTMGEVKKHFPIIYVSIDFGAYIKPENYFVSYIFRTNKELEEAKESGLVLQIIQYHRERMMRNNYPVEAIKDCVFASQEDCEELYNGNWFYYYK